MDGSEVSEVSESSGVVEVWVYGPCGRVQEFVEGLLGKAVLGGKKIGRRRRLSM